MQALMHQFIDNQWVASRGERRLAVIDPYREAVIAEVTAGAAEDVDAAVNAARRALPAWRALGGAARGAYLDALADALETRRSELAMLSSRNNGKPRAEAEQDLSDAIACYRHYAGEARALDARQGEAVATGETGLLSRRYQDPVGVAGLITPWNFPLVSSAWKLAPALAAGCTVVFKPSEVTPLPEQALAEIALAIGLPPGVVNLVHGDGEQVGAPLTAHPGVDKLSFTGSTPVGEAVMAAAARGIRNVSLELGGKSPILVTEDADLDLAAELVLAGFCYNAGQMCSATSRLLVHEAVAEALHARLDAAVAELVAGDPLDAATTLGPLVNAAQRDRVAGFLATAEAEGLAPTTEVRIALPHHGHFVAPRVFRDVPVDSRLWREEIFGPVLCSRSFRDDEAAVAMANDSDFGLAASVVAGDPARAEALAGRLTAGNVWCNTHQVAPPGLGWGGMKGSGIGRELGRAGLEAYLEARYVTRPS
ncbi:aldehyde dehydrogenase family protein [Halomonas nitroreducens]|uniref:Aldehyde dehydrogenase family protein n=1 Tax=Halomonas nitroreducens TaxID=447425 RepID=A0A431V8B9_9GAMM|nr:aldehyde dehydrogenase family protein [Halomonas nitroreducens]RTR06467.1 aldehyde dehydrogenase family protein [Halomonas nitroreducens]